MAINNKPIDYLLCEGASDAVFICLYVENKLGYIRARSNIRTYRSSIVNALFTLMEGPNRYLLVCSCGGCSNINSIFQSVVLPSVIAEGDDCRVIAIIDRDNKTNPDCYSLANFAPVTMQIGSWFSNTIQGNYMQPDGTYNSIRYKSFFSVIPNSSFGAFENVLINSISTNDPSIVNEVNAFYAGLSANAKTHIQTNRLEIKAKLDTMIVLLNPESIYQSLFGLFQTINLNDPNIVSNFSFIDDITNPV